MLKLGSSRPWPDAMEALTGQRNMDASGVMEYFQPLYNWLKAENARTGEYIGWEPSTIRKYYFPHSRATSIWSAHRPMDRVTIEIRYYTL